MQCGLVGRLAGGLAIGAFGASPALAKDSDVETTTVTATSVVSGAVARH